MLQPEFPDRRLRTEEKHQVSTDDLPVNHRRMLLLRRFHSARLQPLEDDKPMNVSLRYLMSILALFLWMTCLRHPTSVLHAAEETRPRQVVLDVKNDGAVVAGGKHKLNADLFPQRLQAAMQKLRQAGVEPTDVLIELHFDEDTTYQQVSHVIELCQQQAVEHFELGCERPCHLHLPLGASSVFAPEAADVIPSLKLRLVAKKDGSLSRMQLNNRALVSTQQLQQELIKIIGDDRGPDSVFRKIELIFDADDDLQTKYVSQAYSAASGYTDSGGKLNPLIQKVFVFGSGSMEEIEEVSSEEVELESLEQNIEPLAPVESPVRVPSVDLPTRQLPWRLPFQRHASFWRPRVVLPCPVRPELAPVPLAASPDCSARQCPQVPRLRRRRATHSSTIQDRR